MQNDSLYPKKRRRNESRLNAHLEVLLDMQKQGYSLVMMQEYLLSFDIAVNTTTIWRYIKKRITRLAGRSNSIRQILSANTYENKVELSKAPNYQWNSTDNITDKSRLEILEDLSNVEREF